MNYKVIALLAFATQTTNALDAIAKYEPGSEVVDHSLIDEDQKSLEAAIILEGKFPSESGMGIYEQGGHSKSYATLTLTAPLTRKIAKKTEFSGTRSFSVDDSFLFRGKAYADANEGDTILKIQYPAGHCLVGALSDTERNLDGCVVFSGTMFDGFNSYNYTQANDYSDNNNGRTLQGFSTAVESKMINCGVGCPEQNALEGFTYYGTPDWADQWIQAANAGGQTKFTNGNADFRQYGYDGQFESIKKSTSYVVALFYALHEFEASVAACVPGTSYDNDNAIHKWDEGVAFYVGSIPGPNGVDSKGGGGKLHWALAGKRCKDFGTCGPNGGEFEGLAQVNYLLRDEFNAGKQNLHDGNCEGAKANMLRISDLAYLPLVQGTLRYAHKVAKKVTGEKGQAEGAVFQTGVLPKVHAQGEAGRKAAKIIYDNMKVSDDPQTSFLAVKEAFESVYEAMGLDCEMVGGYVDDNNEYYTEAPYNSAPCKSKCDFPLKSFPFTRTNLSMSCKQLNNMSPDLKDSVCMVGGGKETCPQTCMGKCACNEKAKDKFTRTNNKKMSCKALSLARKRKQLCKRNPNAKIVCPSTCKNFCDFNPLKFKISA